MEGLLKLLLLLCDVKRRNRGRVLLRHVQDVLVLLAGLRFVLHVTVVRSPRHEAAAAHCASTFPKRSCKLV